MMSKYEPKEAYHSKKGFKPAGEKGESKREEMMEHAKRKALAMKIGKKK